MTEQLAPVRPSRSPVSPVSAADVARVRRPVDTAELLPPHVFHDPSVFAWEQERWFAQGWVCAGRVEDVPESGSYLLTSIAGESVIVIRDGTDGVRAFHNVCRHRGSRLLTEPSGRIARFQCPYHAWTYELDGRLRRAAHTDDVQGFEAEEHQLLAARLELWRGFLFLNLSGDAPPLAEWLADFPDVVRRFPLEGVRRARRIEYEVSANWKAIVENFSECYHCPGVHPQLNRISPYDQGENLISDGPWAGGWMTLRDAFETMSVDGQRGGRPPLPGVIGEDLRRIHYFVLWPNLLLSLHPDYVMTHVVWPIDVERSRVVCEWLFDPVTMAAPGFDPSDAVEFWDLTNRQDWEVCELQQQGTRSRAYTGGRYTLMEDMVHAFDVMVADGYADDGQRTRFHPRHDKWRGARPAQSGRASSIVSATTRTGK